MDVALGCTFVCMLVFALALSSGPALAQAPVRETQVPIVPSQGIVEITPELRARLGLFPEVQGPAALRLFEAAGGQAVLEIEIRGAAMLTRERRPLTGAELESLRALIETRLVGSGGVEALSREGRGRLVLGQTLLGLGFYGWALPVVWDLDSGQAIVASYLLTSGLSFLIPYRLTRTGTVSDAHTVLSMYGGTRGILYGSLFADALLGEGEDANRARLASAILGSVGGSVLGFRAAGRLRPDEGRAALWSAMGDLGLAAGAGLAYVMGPYTSRIVSDDPFGFEEEMRNPALGHALTLGGGITGLLAGRWLGERQVYTRGNVNALQSAAVLGAQTGMTLALSSGTEEERWGVAAALVGTGTGLVLGNRALRERRLTGGEGLLVNAGHLAGGLTALGLTYLAVDDFSDHDVLYMTTGTLGSALGAGLVFRAIP